MSKPLQAGGEKCTQGDPVEPALEEDEDLMDSKSQNDAFFTEPEAQVVNEMSASQGNNEDKENGDWIKAKMEQLPGELLLHIISCKAPSYVLVVNICLCAGAGLIGKYSLYMCLVLTLLKQLFYSKALHATRTSNFLLFNTCC